MSLTEIDALGLGEWGALGAAMLLGFLVAWLLLSHRSAMRLAAVESELALRAQSLAAQQQYLETVQQRCAELAGKWEAAELQCRQAEQSSAVYKAEADAGAGAKAALEQRLQTGLRSLQQQLEESRGEANDLRSELAALESTRVERDAANRRHLELIEEQKTQLTDQFKTLADEILEKKGKQFGDVSESRLSALLQPLQQKLDGFEQQVRQSHDASQQSRAALKAEIEQLGKLNQAMTSEAGNLVKALRGDKKSVGLWGEAQLERILELGGLQKTVHFDSEVSLKDREGNTLRPDCLVRLPGDKCIVIDAKVSLVAYEQAVAAESEEALGVAMTAHAKAVKHHIDSLAAKDYANLSGVNSPGFILMYMPIEPAFLEVMKFDRGLYEYGYNKGVILVCNTTILPLMKTVANLWMSDTANQQIQDVLEKAADLHKQVAIVAERLQKLGNTLATAGNQYNDTVKAMVGSRGLYKKVKRFEGISAKVIRKLPELQHSKAQFDGDRLQLMLNQSGDDAVTPESGEAAVEPAGRSSNIKRI